MTWCNTPTNHNPTIININNNSSISDNNNTNTPISHEKTCSNLILVTPSPPSSSTSKGGIIIGSKISQLRTVACPSCGHHVPLHDQGGGINELPGLPAGVKFDPTDPEILGHLEAKVKSDFSKLHPLLHEFIPTIDGENGICYTHPEKLPGVSKDGVMRHFFHRPSKAYTTGTRKRRKVHTNEEGGETRWHKTGKTRPIIVNGKVKGFKKILVLYTNYGRQKKPEKTNWVMHQYHLGENEEEKDGEFVLSKVFYQTQPRQCGSTIKELPLNDQDHLMVKGGPLNYSYHPSNFINHNPYVVGEQNRESPPQLIPNLVVQGDGSSFVPISARK